METVIITTDFSGTAAHAAKYGASLARQLGTTTIILYHSHDLAPAATAIPIPETDTSLAREGSLLALEVLEGYIRPYAGDNIRIDLVTNELPLLMGVIQLSEERRAGLVVAGTTGKSKLEKFMIGSNTVNLATSCPVPLLIVPDDANLQGIERIVFACDLQKVTKSTPVHLLHLFAEKLKAKILILNVALEGKRFNPDIIPEQYKLHKLLDPLNPEYHYTEEDDIAEGILEFVAKVNAGIVITIPKSYGFFEGLFHRSVTKKLAHHTEVPLLLFREDD